MDSNRIGEQSHTAFRSRRLYSVNGQWYFDTREGKQFGPYQDQNETEKALAIFVAQSVLDLNTSEPTNKMLHPGEQDGIEYMVEELLEFFHFRKIHGQTAALGWANHRLKKLMDNRETISHSDERIEAIKYAMDRE
jgi:hypothetical protein